MNRAERRKQGKNAEKPKTYVLTEEQIEKIRNEARSEALLEATRRTFLMFMAIPVMVLHDKFGFGKQRLNRFLDYAIMWFESVNKDEVKLRELVETVEEECGIQLIGGEKR